MLFKHGIAIVVSTIAKEQGCRFDPQQQQAFVGVCAGFRFGPTLKLLKHQLFVAPVAFSVQ